jgi:hypothetical protein
MPVTTRRQSLAAASPGGKPVARTPTATPVKAAKSKKASNSKGYEEFWRKVFHVLPGLVTYALWKMGHNPHHVAVVIFAMTVVVAGGSTASDACDLPKPATSTTSSKTSSMRDVVPLFTAISIGP